MDVALANPDSSYLEFFNSIIDDTMCAPPLDHPRLPPGSECATEEDTTKVIEERWWASVHRATALKTRLEREKGQIRELIEAYQAGQCLDLALRDRIASNTAWLDSMLRNFNSAIDDHQQSKVLTDVPLLQAKIRGIEQKQLAVEVALQQGPSRETGGDGRDAVERRKDRRAIEMLPEDRLFRMEDASMERIDIDDLHQRLFEVERIGKSSQNTPAIGWFSVPKPTKSRR